MNYIEIQPLDNGAHNNQSGGGCPEGWAIIPESVGTPDTLENFPFGEVTAEEIDGVMTVTSWIPGEMPEPEPETPTAPSELEQLRADVDYIAMETGVEL